MTPEGARDLLRQHREHLYAVEAYIERYSVR